MNYLFVNKYRDSSKEKTSIMAKRVRRALSTATKFKMSLAKQGSKNPRYGKHLTEEQKKRISVSMKRYWLSILQ